MITVPFSTRRVPLHGLSLLEIIVSMGLMSSIMLVVIQTVHFMAGGVNSAQAQSDSTTRSSGTIYDIVAELRQATAYSTNFYIEQNPAIPPSITFDLVAGVDGKGNILWGNKISYSLQLMPQAQAAAVSYLGIDAAQLIRTETDAQGNVSTSLVEDKIPYQYSENGVVMWGFAVFCNGNTLTLSLSHFADSGIASGHVYQNVSDGSNAAPQLIIVNTTGTYYLRNPQAVITLN